MATSVLLGDVSELLSGYPDNSFDAVLCDPPYGLAFMGKRWDYDVPSVELWAEVLRVCKPGAALLAFFGTRTYHRGVVRIEDAGFEIRDCISWLYGSGFPKSLDVSKALDAKAGAVREVVGQAHRKATGRMAQGEGGYAFAEDYALTAPATDAAREWDGYGTALKPACEPAVLARKPLDGTVAENVTKWGVGALAIDACRVGFENGETTKRDTGTAVMWANAGRIVGGSDVGRWPANVILDEEAGAVLGAPARFFYCAKASKRERGEGSTHPTVKPISLCTYLARLIMPPRPGKLLVPFAGSGSEMLGAIRAGWPDVVGIEREPAYVEIAKRRLAA